VLLFPGRDVAKESTAQLAPQTDIVSDQIVTRAQGKSGFQGTVGNESKRSDCVPLLAIRRKTECPRRVGVSLTLGFDSHRLHYLAPCPHAVLHPAAWRLPLAGTDGR